MQKSFTPIATAVARVLLALMFIGSGISKFVDPGPIVGMIMAVGFPEPTVLAYLAGVFELAAGVAVLIGYQTSIAASLLALFCVFTAFTFHRGALNIPGFPPQANGLLTMMNSAMMWKDITLAGGYVLLAVAGAGKISVDFWLASKSGRVATA
jgi:putative oxidoreductase